VLALEPLIFLPAILTVSSIKRTDGCGSAALSDLFN
jgi:hypothetical protein